MNAKKTAQDALQKSYPFRIEGLSMHQNTGDKHVNVALPVGRGSYQLLKVLGEGGVQAIAAINASIVSYQPSTPKPISALTTCRNSIAIRAMVGLAVFVFFGAYLFRRSNTQAVDVPLAKAASPLVTPQSQTVVQNQTVPIVSNGPVLPASALDRSEDGNKLALAFGPLAVVVDASSGRELQRLAGHSKELQAAQLTSNASHCLTGSVDRTIRIWSIAESKEIRRNEVPTTPNAGLGISPDKEFAISSSRGADNDPSLSGVVSFVSFRNNQENSTKLAPELSELSEAPEGLSCSVPAVTQDGLTLFCSGTRAGDRSIWTASRKDNESLFENFTKLFAGNEPTISSDGLELIFVDSIKNLPWSATRASRNDTFKRPNVISEFAQERLTNPFLTNNDLVLYAHRPASEKGKIEIVRASRPKRGAPWAKLEIVPIGGSVEIFLGSVSNDEKLLLGYSRPDYQGKSKNDLFLLTRTGSKLGFEKPTSLNIPDLPATSTFPRYSEGNRELLFGSYAQGKGAKLWIVKNFDPTATSKVDQSTIQRSSSPQLSEVSETPEGLNCSVPTITKDGLTLFCSGNRAGDTSKSIWTASRKDHESLFENFAKVFSGNEPTISSDGLELIFVDPVKHRGLWSATRASMKDKFKRPNVISEFAQEPLTNPILTNNDLVLYAHGRSSEKGKFEIVRASRPKRGAPWAKLEIVPIGGSSEIFLGSVSNDEKLLLGYSRPDYQGKSKNDLFLLTRTGSKLGFEKPTSLNIPDLPATSTFPRYSEVNRELLFSSFAQGKGAKLWLVRDFVPFQIIESNNPQ